MRRVRSPLKTFALVLGVAAVLGNSPLPAATGPSLQAHAGSYTGTASSRTASGTLTSGATLTFTGRPGRMRGTFLYTGFLNSSQMQRSVVQVLNVSNEGVLSGRVTVDGVVGRGHGAVKLRGNKMAVNITYTIGGAKGTSITLDGQITFRGHWVKWATNVTSSNRSYKGRLLVTGRR